MVFIQRIIYLKKDRVYVINLEEFKSIGTRWVSLYVNGDNVTYFDSSGVEYIPEEIKKFIENKHIARNICRTQANDSIMCAYFYIGFIYFMIKGKGLLFFPNKYEKNDKIILEYFQ